MVGSYLCERKVTVNFARSTSEKETTKGCVQGSIGGPTFWNIILDQLLKHLDTQDVRCQAFADDVVLIFSGTSITQLEQSANKTLQTVVEWGKQNKLNFAPHKTFAMVMTKKLKLNKPEIYMSGKAITLVDEIKILGLTINKTMTFASHVASICKKAAEIYKQLARAAKVTWGLNPEIIRTIYVSVIEPIITYAASAWAPATELKMIQDALNSTQRGFAIKMCKAYRTVSLTSALALSGILPLDLRVQEAATLHKTKKGISLDYLPPGKELEAKVNLLDQPHPSNLTTINYKLLENMDPQTIQNHHITGPQIYTDGSKIEAQTGAALTWWENGKEISHATYSLDPCCTVFQAEMYALHKAVEMVKGSSERMTNILSDSRSSLDLLQQPKATLPLAHKIHQDLQNITQSGRVINMFWLRAHVGTVGNERADELAKTAALDKKPTYDYQQIPLSYAKRKIREESVRKWQDRYSTSSTGAVTREFLPEVNSIYRMVRKTKLTPIQVQVLTGHGGIAEYLHKYKLINSPSCECDRATSETVWHLIQECPRFLTAKFNLEVEIGKNLTRETLPQILLTEKTRVPFLIYAETIFRKAAKRHSDTTGVQREAPNTNNPDTTHQPMEPTTQPHTPQQTSIDILLQKGERGVPGIRTRGVALFMNTPHERLGISFYSKIGPNSVAIAPGLAALTRGSTTRTTIKRKEMEGWKELEIGEHQYRLIRTKNKELLMIEIHYTTGVSQFDQVSKLLTEIAEESKRPNTTPRIISVDTLSLAYYKGEVQNHLGSLKAADHHEVVVYENRGENLCYLRQKFQNTPPASASTSSSQTNSTTVTSGSERLQKKYEEQREATIQQPEKLPKSTFSSILKSLLSAKRPQGNNLNPIKDLVTATVKPTPLTVPKTIKRAKRTNAEMGQVTPPTYREIVAPVDHYINAFLEYVALIKASRRLKIKECSDILYLLNHRSEGLLKAKLQETEATIYNNNTSEVIRGKEMKPHMAAYSATGGMVSLDKDETERSGSVTYQTPYSDPLVVTTQNTEIWLDDMILERAENLTQGDSLENWTLPNITLVNGVPGCGKTTWIINNFREETDMVITTTIEAKSELSDRVSKRNGAEAATKIRTVASLLTNGIPERQKGKCSRLIADEALMNHFGSIVMATQISGANDLLLIGDINQLPYIERENLFETHYHRPEHLINTTQALMCTHRCPMDVACALKLVYNDIYSSSKAIKTIRVESYTGAAIPKTQAKTLFLTYTQQEKSDLRQEGYGTGEESRVLTIHEAQGLCFENVIVVKKSSKSLQIHDSVPHAVVAISRHTRSFIYHADNRLDALGKIAQASIELEPKQIMEHNLKMAIQNRDKKVIESLTGSD